MDALDHLIQLSQLQGEVNVRCLFQGNWQLHHQIENPQMGVFHLVEQGECWLKFNNQTFHLQAGDLFYLPREQIHQLSYQNSFRKTNLSIKSSKQGIFQVQHLGNGEEFKMFCGRFIYAQPAFLIDCLPTYIHFPLNSIMFNPLLNLLQQEAQQTQLGGRSIINALVEILFTHILRYLMQNNLIEQGVLAGLLDKRLHNVLEHLLTSSERDWDIIHLATLANMSRATFMRVFQQKMGISPGKFLIQLRLQKAALLLKQTQKTIMQVALEVGYQSEAHFSKAFKMLYGMPPSQYRKN